MNNLFGTYTFSEQELRVRLIMARRTFAKFDVLIRQAEAIFLPGDECVAAMRVKRVTLTNRYKELHAEYTDTLARFAAAFSLLDQTEVPQSAWEGIENAKKAHRQLIEELKSID